MNVPRPVAPRAGEVLKIHEANYRYGVGELTIRVTAVRGLVQLKDGAWLTVEGVQIAWDGADIGEREVLVRMSSLIPQRGRG